MTYNVFGGTLNLTVLYSYYQDFCVAGPVVCNDFHGPTLSTAGFLSLLHYSQTMHIFHIRHFATMCSISLYLTMTFSCGLPSCSYDISLSHLCIEFHFSVYFANS